jgi:hypothetical protein
VYCTSTTCNHHPETATPSLSQVSINVSRKYFLNIGFGYGFNAEIPRYSVARVIGAESDATASAYAIQNEKINEANTHRGRLQDMLKSFAKDVDITALFL